MKKLQNFINATWWLILLRGLVLLAFGVTVLIWPSISLEELVVIFALFYLLEGAVELLVGMAAIQEHRFWFIIIAKGILGVAVGVFALTHNNFDIDSFTVLAGLTLFGAGILSIISTFEDYEPRIKFANWGVGVLAILAGIVIVLYPADQGLEFIWALGTYGLLGGIMLLTSAIDMKNFLDRK